MPPIRRAQVPYRPTGPMPTTWVVSNFKPIERAEVDLRRLVVLAGANSSGKSSLFQSLLFLAQSEPEESPVLNGPLVGLGEATDVIRDGQRVMSFGCRLSVPPSRTQTSVRAEDPEERRRAEIELSYDMGGRDLRLASVVVSAEGDLVLEAVRVRDSHLPEQFHGPMTLWNPLAGVLRVTALAGGKKPRQTYIAAGELFPEAMLYRTSARKQLAYLKDRYPLEELQSPRASEGRFIDFGTEIRRLLDTQVNLAAEVSQWGRRDLRERIRGMTPSEYERLLASLAEGLQWTLDPLDVRRSLSVRRGFAARSYLADDELSAAIYYLSAGIAALRELALSLCYLGPLRDAPRLISRPGQGTRTTPVGVSGEFTADFLARNANNVIKYFTPAGEPHTEAFESAVTQWVDYLGVGTRVVVEDQRKLGRSLRLEVDGKERDLTAVGVGASQLLPVIALVLGAPSRSLVLLEQPELHLHPAVQSRLADFLSRARSDVGIIVETHSEYLVSRLRLRVAEQAIQPSHIGILFVHRENGVTEIRDLELGPLGDLDLWPKGFFDTSEREAADLVRAVHARLDADE